MDFQESVKLFSFVLKPRISEALKAAKINLDQAPYPSSHLFFLSPFPPANTIWHNTICFSV
jgi:hypothetical protein